MHRKSHYGSFTDSRMYFSFCVNCSSALYDFVASTKILLTSGWLEPQIDCCLFARLTLSTFLRFVFDIWGGQQIRELNLWRRLKLREHLSQSRCPVATLAVSTSRNNFFLHLLYCYVPRFRRATEHSLFAFNANRLPCSVFVAIFSTFATRENLCKIKPQRRVPFRF